MPRVRADNDARYALRASFVDSDGEIIQGDTIVIGTGLWQQNGTDIYYNNGNVGVGTTDPESVLHLKTDAGDAILIIEADPSNTNENDTPYITFRADGSTATSALFGLAGGNDNFVTGVNANALVMRATGNRDIQFLNSTAVTATFDASNNATFNGNITATGTLSASGYNNSNWDTAYGWGNHASAGYLTAVPATYAPRVSTELNSSTNLNNLNAAGAGFYHQTANADTPGNNYPSNEAGSLLVQKSAGNATQMYITYNGNSAQLYFRANYNSGYGSWKRVWTDADFASVPSSPVQSGAGGGQYGSVYIDGGATGGYEGYSIGGRAVFMHNNGSATGIYNDVNNHWLFYGAHNGETRMYHAGVQKIYTYGSGGRVTGNLLATSDVYAYYSDERLKDVVGAIEEPLESVRAIETFYYTHNDKARELGYEGSERQVGVSAQSVKAVLPEVIGRAPIDDDGEGGSVTGEDYMTVKYERIVPLLIEAIKELTDRVEELERDRTDS